MKSTLKLMLIIASLFLLLLLGGNLQAQDQNENTSIIQSVDWSPDGTKIAVGGGEEMCSEGGLSSYSVQIINVHDGQIEKHLIGASCNIEEVSWSPDSTKVAAASTDGSGVRVWNVYSGQIISTQQEAGQGNIAVKWNPSGTQLAISDGAGAISILDAQTGQTINYPNVVGAKLDWSPTGDKLLVANGTTNNAYVVEVESSQELFKLTQHTAPVTSVDWSPDGRFLATGSADNTIKLWDAETGTLLQTLQGHTALVTQVMWNTDSTKVVSSSNDGSIRIWDRVTGVELYQLQTSSPIYTVAWSPEGTQLAYGGSGVDGKVAELQIVDIDQIPAPTQLPEVTP